MTEDTTLTNDYLWIIENSLYIPEGITLTIEPGTKVQFYSSDYENAYGGLTIANIICDGTLNAIGTEDELIEMYPGAGFEQYCVEIAGDGLETLKYCNIINPRLGYTATSNAKIVNTVDHCVLTQNYDYADYRYSENGVVKEPNGGWAAHYFINIGKLSNTQLYGIRYNRGTLSYAVHINAYAIENCMFNSCWIRVIAPSTPNYVNNRNNVYLTGDVVIGKNLNEHSKFVDFISIKQEMVPAPVVSQNKIYTYDGAESKYVKVHRELSNDYIEYDYLNSVAKSIGGTIACINDETEE